MDVMGEQMQSVSLDGVEFSIPKNVGPARRNSHDSGHLTDDEHSLSQSQVSLEHPTHSREGNGNPQSSDPHFVDERDSSEDGSGEGDSSEEDVQYVRFGTRPTEARPTERRSQIAVNPDSANTHFDISQSQNSIHVGTQYSLHLSPDLIQVLKPGETVAVEFPRENAVIRISMEGLDNDTGRAMERQIMENLGQPSFFSQLYTTVWRWSLGILRVIQIRRGCIEIVLASDDKKATDLLKTKLKDGLLDEDIRALILQDNVMKIANGANFKLKIELVENDQVDDGIEPLKIPCLTHDEVASTINKLSTMCQEEELKAETAWSPMGWWPRSTTVPANKDRFKEVDVPEHGVEDLSSHVADYVGDGIDPLKKPCLTHDEVASKINKLSTMCLEEELKAETAYSPMGWWPRSTTVSANKDRFIVRVKHGRHKEMEKAMNRQTSFFSRLYTHIADYVGNGLVKTARAVGTKMAWPLLPVKVAWMGLQSMGLFRQVIDVNDALLRLPPPTQLLLYHSVQDALKGMGYPPGTPIGVALADEENKGKILETLKAFITDELSMKIVTTPHEKDVGLAQSKEQRSQPKFIQVDPGYGILGVFAGRKK